jgi:hypothetical protein
LARKQKPPAPGGPTVIKLSPKKSRKTKPTPAPGVETPAPEGVEGVKMEDKYDGENAFESINKAGESFMKLDNVKKAAAWYIDTSEKFATQMIELQEKATGWAKETPFAPLFEAQNSVARKLVERSVSAARNLWQLNAE